MLVKTEVPKVCSSLLRDKRESPLIALSSSGQTLVLRAGSYRQ